MEYNSGLRASTFNIETLERFQLKALCIIVDTPWPVLNMVIRRDLQTPAVEEEIRRYNSQYKARFIAHPNDIVVNLLVQSTCQMICLPDS
jgi:hypothetical protein